MSRVAFVQFEMRARIGTMQLSSMLKKHGHEASVFISYDKDLVADVLKYRPSVVGFSSSTIEHVFALDMAKRLRWAGCRTPIIMGGPHPTFYPEETIKYENINALCAGEGDDLIVEIANRIDSNADFSDLKNLWVKKDGIVVKNEMRDLIEDLDSLPFPDRDIYFKKHPVLRNNPTATFILGRGCPFNCSYCFNHLLKKIYAGKGRFVRFPSVDYAIFQIKDARKKYGFKWVQLNDDTININRKWFEEFLKRYKKEIGVPFICNIRADAMDEDLADLMVYAGVDRITFGLESGNEKIRKNILNRNTPNEQMIKVGHMFKKRGVRVFTANMIALPGETVNNVFETIDVNRKIKPELAAFDVLQPFPKTDIFNYCVKNNLLDGNVSSDDYFGFNCVGWGANKRTGSILRQDNIKELVNLQKFSGLLVRHYWLKPFVKVLIKMKPNRVFNFLNSYNQTRHKIKHAAGFGEKLFYIRDLLMILIKG